jgi:broad specificity phosphatase PhoE
MAIDNCVVVVRHAERQDTVDNEQGVADSALSAAGTAATPQALQGMQQALSSAMLASGHDSAAASCSFGPHVDIATSPFLRTVQTAVALRDALSAMPVCRSPTSGPPRRQRHRGRVVVERGIGEVFGPQRIKVDAPPPLDAGVALLRNGLRHDEDDDADDAGEPTVHGQLPPWGETVPDAQKRMAAAFRSYLDAPPPPRHAATPPVTLLVTHGDAMQATLAAVYPSRTVYDCHFLSHLVFVHRAAKDAGGAAGWSLAGSEGVFWMVDDDAKDGGSADARPDPPARKSSSNRRSSTAVPVGGSGPYSPINSDDGGRASPRAVRAAQADRRRMLLTRLAATTLPCAAYLGSLALWPPGMAALLLASSIAAQHGVEALWRVLVRWCCQRLRGQSDGEAAEEEEPLFGCRRTRVVLASLDAAAYGDVGGSDFPRPTSGDRAAALLALAAAALPRIGCTFLVFLLLGAILAAAAGTPQPVLLLFGGPSHVWRSGLWYGQLVLFVLLDVCRRVAFVA